MAARTLAEIWPFFGLKVSTPQLTLVYPNDELVAALIATADEGIHDPDYSPFSGPWSIESPEKRAQSMAQFQWECRADLSPERWRILFAVIVDGEVVGAQDIFTRDFHKTKTAGTGSWLGQSHQGKGIGTEMRRAILHFLFVGLGADLAETGAFAHNKASQRVTEKLGYRPNGESIEKRGDGQVERTFEYRLERSDWEANRSDDVSIDGLEPCLPFLGL